jgi:hypothetical protein
MPTLHRNAQPDNRILPGQFAEQVTLLPDGRPEAARPSIPLDTGEGLNRLPASRLGAAVDPASCHEGVVSN